MAVESNYAIAIATRGGWLKSLAPVFQRIKASRDFSRALMKLLLRARNSDLFIALFAPVMIGRSNYYGIALETALRSTRNQTIQLRSQ